MMSKEIRLLEKFVEGAAEDRTELGNYCVGCQIQIDALDVSVRPVGLKPNIHKRGCFVVEAKRLIEKEKQMAKGKKSFPKTLYAKWEDVGGEPWIGTFDKAENALEAGEQVSIATYELKEVRKGRLLPELK